MLRLKRMGVVSGVMGCGNFRRRDRLSGEAAFAAVFDAKVRTSKGALTAVGRPNALAHWRLGISIGRKAGNAVRRNRIKRMIREAFRLERGNWPGAYDLIMVARAHEPLTLEEYRRYLSGFAVRLHEMWRKKGAAAAGNATPQGTGGRSGIEEPRTQ